MRNCLGGEGGAGPSGSVLQFRMDVPVSTLSPAPEPSVKVGWARGP